MKNQINGYLKISLIFLTVFVFDSAVNVSLAQESKVNLKELPKANKRMVKFVEKHMGEKLGDGECPRVVFYGLYDSSAWIDENDSLDYLNDNLLPGDVIHMYRTDSIEGFTQHYAVIMEVINGPEVIVGHQNVGGRKYVQKDYMNLESRGEYSNIKVMRPYHKGFFYNYRKH